MEPFATLGALVAAIAAIGGAIQSYRLLRLTRDAELKLSGLLLKNTQLRSRLLSELSKSHDVGDQTLADFQTAVTKLLMQMPRDQRQRISGGLYQPSRRGRRDFLLKVASEHGTGQPSVGH